MFKVKKKPKVFEVCKALKIPFGDIEAKVEEVFSYYWWNDPYTQGVYALFSKNQPDNIKDILRERHVNVLFAGEHTEMLQGFMEGAVESGESAAIEIMGE